MVITHTLLCLLFIVCAAHAGTPCTQSGQRDSTGTRVPSVYHSTTEYRSRGGILAIIAFMGSSLKGEVELEKPYAAFVKSVPHLLFSRSGAVIRVSQ